MGRLDSLVTRMSWSHDEAALFAQTLNNSGLYHIHVLDMNSGEIVQVTQKFDRASDVNRTTARWSPIENRLLFEATFGYLNLFTYDVVTRDVQQLTYYQDAEDFSMDWSPDGNHVLYSVTRANGVRAELYRLHVASDSTARRVGIPNEPVMPFVQWASLPGATVTD